MKAKHCTLGHVLGVLLVLCGSLFLSCTNENELSGDQNDGTDPGRIATLEDQAASIEASIRDLEEVYEKHEELIEKLSTEVSGLEDLLDALESSGAYEDPTETQAYKELKERYSSLQNAKSLLSEKIDSLEAGISKLQEYVDGELADTKDWAEATSHTLEQYGKTLDDLLSIQNELEDIKTFVEENEGINDRINALESAIEDAENYMKSWVNETLAERYYDIATIESKLEALESKLSEADDAQAEDLKGQIKDQIGAQQDALEEAKEELTEAYERAISAAIKDNNGDIDDKIAKDIETANKYVDTKIGKINEEIVKLDERITAMEETVKNHGERIQTVEEQIDSIKVSIGELKDVRSALEGFKTTLESEADDLREQLKANTEADYETKKALEDSIQFIKSQIDTLKVKDEDLDKQIAALQEYVDGELKSSEDWIKSTFATLEKYNEVQENLSSIDALVKKNEGDISAINESINEIAKAEESMKEWVNKTLAEGYYTKIEFDLEITALRTQVTEGDDALQKEIDDLAADLAEAESYLTAAYTDAINTAITDNNGIISDEIAAAVKTAQDNLQAQIDAINSEIEKIKARLDVIETNIKSINQQIVAIEESIGELEDVRSALEENINHLEERLSSLEDQQGSSSPSPSDPEDVSALQEEINKLNGYIRALEEEYQALDEQIAMLQEYVDGELKSSEDWIKSTFATLEKYNEVQENLSSIDALVKKNEDDISAIKESIVAIEDAEKSMKSWVNETLAAGYYDIATIESKLEALETNLSGVDAKLAKDLADHIKAQQDALKDAKEELTNAYKQAISAAIEKNGGDIDDKIAASVKEVQDKVNEDLQFISDDIDELKTEIEELRSQIESILGMVLSVVYMPEYSDGAAYVGIFSRTLEMSFKLSPSSVVASLKEVWESSLSVKFLTTKSTKAAPVMKDLSIKSAEFDETIGTVTVTVDCSNLAQSFYTGETSASASLFIYDGHSNNVSSDFVPLVLNEDETIDLPSLEAANCYIVSESGWYQFRSAKGNSMELLSDVEYAEVLWESFGTDVTPEEGDLVSAALYRDGNIYFKTADTFKEGNAVIAAKDASGKILWSWHIWLTDQPEEQVYYNNAGTMMDRNLGATSATPGDVGALGLFYQWGRKDPFLGSSSISENIEAKSTITWPSTVFSDSSTGTIDYVVSHPTAFVHATSPSFDWHYSLRDNTFWTTSDKAKSVYDPCPAGWRIPDGKDNDIWAYALGYSNFNAASHYNITNRGVNFSDMLGPSSNIWYPASGQKISGGDGISKVGFNGEYWSTSDVNEYYMSFLSIPYNTYGNTTVYSGRWVGRSVRCIKEGTGGGSSDSGDSNDNNVKEKREFDLGAQEVKWSYTPDAAQDANKYLGLPYSYDRTLQVALDEIKVQGAGEDYPTVLSTGTLTSTTVNGVTSTAVTFGYDAVSTNATVTYTGFEWDKTYDIVAKYETSATDVEIKFTLTTVDRKREPIIVKTDPTVSTTEKPLVYKKDMAIAQGTYNVPFGDKLFEELETAGNIAGIDKAAYLTDVFNSSKPYYDILNSWYDNDLWDGGRFLKDDAGADTWSIRLVIDGAACEFTFGYSYKSFPEVITNLKYVREFTTWYGQEFVLEHVLTIDLPKYDFAHTSYYVKANADNTGWYSIIGQYFPSITASDVYAFEPNLDMNKVFNVVDRATATPTIIPAAELATYGLVTEFELESTIPGITITDNEISYLSSEAQIGVTGKLYIENTGGLKLYLPTSFADTYANYVVKKCDPIGKLTVTGTPVVELSEAKIYTVNVMDYLELKDNRNGVPTCDLIVDGAFLNGDGTNGYSGPVTSIYGLEYRCMIEAFPSEFFSIISFNDRGVLTFDNTAQLTLFEDIVIPIRFSLSSLWCYYQVTVNVVFVKNVE